MSSSLKQLFGLDGETALVIGGMGSIGHTMAMAMAEAGADVLLDQVRTCFLVPFHYVVIDLHLFNLG